MCKTSEVSKSGYYNWLKSEPSKRWFENQAISMHIKDIFEKSFESYGSPRIKVELEKRGYYTSRPRVARIMRANYGSNGKLGENSIFVIKRNRNWI